MSDLIVGDSAKKGHNLENNQKSDQDKELLSYRIKK